jgi:hypothetical protein
LTALTNRLTIALYLLGVGLGGPTSLWTSSAKRCEHSRARGSIAA